MSLDPNIDWSSVIVDNRIVYDDPGRRDTTELSHALVYTGAVWAIWFVTALRLCALDAPN